MADSPGLFTLVGVPYWDFTVQVSGSDATTANATATDVTGLTFPANANSVYEVEAYLIASSSDTNGVNYTVNFSAAGAVGSAYVIVQTAAKTSGVEDYMDLGTLNINALLTLGGSTKCGALVGAIVSTGANTGNITIQHAKLVAGTSSVYIGSILRIRKLSPIGFLSRVDYWDSILTNNSDQITSNTTLTDIGGLSFAASANRSYEVFVYLTASSSDANGMALAIAYSAAGAVGSVITRGQTSSKVTGSTTYSNLGTGTGISFCTVGGSVRVGIWMRGLVVTGANAGNITVQQRKTTSGTCMVYSGPVMAVKAIG